MFTLMKPKNWLYAYYILACTMVCDNKVICEKPNTLYSPKIAHRNSVIRYLAEKGYIEKIYENNDILDVLNYGYVKYEPTTKGHSAVIKKTFILLTIGLSLIAIVLSIIQLFK